MNDSVIRFSYGKNSCDPSPIRVESFSWEELDVLLREGRVAREPSDHHKVRETPFIAPFLLYPDTVGKSINHIEVMGAWIPGDIDTKWTIDSLSAKLDGVRCIIYTTTKSRAHDQRLRVLIALSREYAPEEYLLLWHAINLLLDEALDPATKNPNRLSYVAAHWKHADNVYRSLAGIPLDVDALIETVGDLAESRNPKFTSTNPVTAIPGTITSAILVTSTMIERFRSAPEGRRFYKLMIAMASRAIYFGWATSAQDICSEALTVDGAITGKRRPNALQEAQNALGWAQRHMMPTTPLDRMRNKLIRRLTIKK